MSSYILLEGGTDRLLLESGDFLVLEDHVGGSGITGSLAATEAADTLAASGTFTPATITGTLAATEAADTLSASGTFSSGATSYLLSSYSTGIRRIGKWDASGGGGGSYVSGTNGAALRFRATCTNGAIASELYQQGLKADLWIDGVYTSTVTTPNTSSWAVTSLFTGLDTAAEHEYMLQFNSPGGGPGSMFVRSIEVSSLNTSPPPARTTFAAYGDSITQGVSATSGATVDNSRISSALGLEVWNYGHQGTTVWSNSGAAVNAGETAARVALVTGVSPAPAKVLIRYGLNDAGQVLGAESEATFQASYITMLTALTAGLPSTIFYCQSLIKTTGGGYPAYTTWDAAISAAVTSVNTTNGNSNCRFIAIDGWTEYTATSGVHTSDSVHPNDAGYTLLANREIPLIADTGVTVSGPSSGASGVASSAFTVTLAGGATFTGDQTVTLTTSGGTITATAGTVSGNGTGTVVVTPANAATTFTFTFTPSSTGTKSIALTNGQSWTNPSDVSYAAAGSHTGTLAVTEAADTLVASGSRTVPSFTGTLAVTEAADTLSAFDVEPTPYGPIHAYREPSTHTVREGRMSAQVTTVYRSIDEDPGIAYSWLDRDGTVIDLSGATFSLVVTALDGTAALTKTSGITGYDVSPNVVVTWDTGELATLDVGTYMYRLTATVSSRQRTIGAGTPHRLIVTA